MQEQFMCVYGITDHYSEWIKIKVLASWGENCLASFVSEKVSQQPLLVYMLYGKKEGQRNIM